MSFGEELLWRSRMAALLLPHTPFQKHRPSLKITNWEWISNNNAQKGEKMVVGEMCMKPPQVVSKKLPQRIISKFCIWKNEMRPYFSYFLYQQ